MTATVVVTGIAIEIPGIESLAAWRAGSGRPTPGGDFFPDRKLGRKGLGWKDRATRLALCAARSAIEDAGLTPVRSDAFARTGVVVSSNLGNVDTVCRVAATIHADGVDHANALDVPNASSNVIASTVAIRFGCRAVNLMLCNGSSSGADAIELAGVAIRARRAERMLVIGVEPTNEIVGQLARASNGAARRPGEGAAALVLEDYDTARARGATIYAAADGHGCRAVGSLAASVQAWRAESTPRAALWLTPPHADGETRHTIERLCAEWESPAMERSDIGGLLDDTSGATGVLECAMACAWLRDHPEAVAMASCGGDSGDGWTTVRLRGRAIVEASAGAITGREGDDAR